jgi:hypothetical protein
MYYDYAGLELGRRRPNTQADYPGQAQVRSLVARGSVVNSVGVSSGTQTTFVYVTDQLGRPIPGAAVTVIVHYPDGDQVFTLPPTSPTGTSFRTFVVPTVAAGTIVSIDFILGYAGVFGSTRTSFMIWY